MTTLPTVPITAPELPSPLPTDHQELVDLFYNHWQSLNALVRANNDAIRAANPEAWNAPEDNGLLREVAQEEIAAVMPPKVNAAVILGNMHYQIFNGGWMQYDDNGYSTSVDAARALYEGAAKLGIENASVIVDLIDEFKKRKANADSSNGQLWLDDEDDEDGNYDIYDDLDDKYYAVAAPMQEILDRFEEVTAYGFMSVAYRNAA